MSNNEEAEELGINDDISFDEWYDIFLGELKKRDYSGPVDKHTFEEDWEDGKSPEDAAAIFMAG